MGNLNITAAIPNTFGIASIFVIYTNNQKPTENVKNRIHTFIFSLISKFLILNFNDNYRLLEYIC